MNKHRHCLGRARNFTRLIKKPSLDPESDNACACKATRKPFRAPVAPELFGVTALRPARRTARPAKTGTAPRPDPRTGRSRPCSTRTEPTPSSCRSSSRGRPFASSEGRTTSPWVDVSAARLGIGRPNAHLSLTVDRVVREIMAKQTRGLITWRKSRNTDVPRVTAKCWGGHLPPSAPATSLLDRAARERKVGAIQEVSAPRGRALRLALLAAMQSSTAHQLTPATRKHRAHICTGRRTSIVHEPGHACALNDCAHLQPASNQAVHVDTERTYCLTTTTPCARHPWGSLKEAYSFIAHCRRNSAFFAVM